MHGSSRACPQVARGGAARRARAAGRAWVLLSLSGCSALLGVDFRDHGMRDDGPADAAPGVRRDTATDANLAEAGNCEAQCAAPPFAQSRCTFSQCDFECDSLHHREGGACLEGAAVDDVTAGVRPNVALAWSHACGISPNNQLFCWGNGAQGQLGLGLGDEHLAPTPLPGFEQTAHVAVGVAHSCAARTDGSVWCFGANESGQLGLGMRGDTAWSPERVHAFGGAAELALGLSFSCARTVDGDVSCWGKNDVGQLGLGSATQPVPTPTPLSGLGKVRSIDAGGDFACAILVDRSVRCWGSNAHGQLGLGTTAGPLSASPSTPAGLGSVVQLTLNEDGACALKTDGRVFCWGANTSGQVGTGLAGTDVAIPYELPGLRARAMASGTRRHCAVTTEAKVQCWGANPGNLMALAEAPARVLAPTALPLVGDAKRLYGGPSNLCVSNAQNKVFCWGSDTFGQLGQGTRSNVVQPEPRLLAL